MMDTLSTAVFVRWFLNIPSGCLASNRQLVRWLGHERTVVLNRLALLCKVWHAGLMCVLDYGDLPTMIFMRTRKNHQCPRLIPRLPGRLETDMEYAVAVEIAWSMKRWSSRTVRYLRPRWVNEDASISYWYDGTVKEITSTWMDLFASQGRKHLTRSKSPIIPSHFKRTASEPVISKSNKRIWQGGSQEWMGASYSWQAELF